MTFWRMTFHRTHPTIWHSEEWHLPEWHPTMRHSEEWHSPEWHSAEWHLEEWNSATWQSSKITLRRMPFSIITAISIMTFIIKTHQNIIQQEQYLYCVIVRGNKNVIATWWVSFCWMSWRHFLPFQLILLRLIYTSDFRGQFRIKLVSFADYDRCHI